MLVAGAQSLEANKKIVDALNVFPVPDGDTGTNMSLTMESAVKDIRGNNIESLEEVANLAANGSLMGARGNSGVILSQLLRGFAKGVEGKEKLNTMDFAHALKLASDTAYKAVMKPVEGTMLTVARKGADRAISIAKEEKNIILFLEKIILYAEEVLMETPQMLKVLKDAGVVDAGGKGLIYIYLGALASLTGKMPTTEDIEIMQQTVEHDVHVDEEIEFTYCTEFIINIPKGSPQGLKEIINAYGDSMLVVGNENVIKVHIHTNNPGQILEEGLKLGELSDIKIDNMRLQQSQSVLQEILSSPKNTVNKRYGFITVTMGQGLTAIFKDFDVDYVIKGGQTMNPSTEDFIKAIDNVEADTIFILPNNGNIVMAANQAKEISTKDIRVIPTKTIPQGIASLMEFNLEDNADQNEEQMLEAIENVKTGQITYAIRDTNYNDIMIKKGNIIGLGEKEIQTVGSDVFEVSVDLFSKLVTDEDEIITIFYGEDISEDEANKLSEYLEKQYPYCDVEAYYGGQPLYYYIFSIE